MTFLDTAALAEHRSFRDRVAVAMTKTAVNVAAEGPSDDARKDSLRSALATNVLNDPLGYTERFTWAVLTNAQVAANGLNAPDGDLEYTLSTVWDAIAGV